ncbi:hypothetical protein D9757_001153 [Collybiopsis confluens]|uniref:Uncharacterized protein n=1 Tax=Collybiopsis confluens TaxID=2823264 RepID=A0A8H5I0X4_9AGAR|nr:hypothetical protein D9757_001153 [Collybiopsis confluens]
MAKLMWTKQVAIVPSPGLMSRLLRLLGDIFSTDHILATFPITEYEYRLLPLGDDGPPIFVRNSSGTIIHEEPFPYSNLPPVKLGCIPYLQSRMLEVDSPLNSLLETPFISALSNGYSRFSALQSLRIFHVSLPPVETCGPKVRSLIEIQNPYPFRFNPDVPQMLSQYVPFLIPRRLWLSRMAQPVQSIRITRYEIKVPM